MYVVVVDAQLCLSGTIMFSVAYHQHMCVCVRSSCESLTSVRFMGHYVDAKTTVLDSCSIPPIISCSQDRQQTWVMLLMGVSPVTTCETTDWSNDILLCFCLNCESLADLPVVEFLCCCYWWCLCVCKYSMSYHHFFIFCFMFSPVCSSRLQVI